MGTAIVTITIMPESPEVDLKRVEDEAMKMITAFADDRQKRVEVKPVAFGLKSVNIVFLMDEAKGDTEPLINQLQTIAEVQSVEVSDMRRIIG